jgi:hypothetical protein
MARRGALLLGATLLLAAPGAASQTPPPESIAVIARRTFWVRPVASLLVPGTGQFLAHQDRGAVYVATELYALTRFIQLTIASHRDARRFRDLAFQAARAPFNPTSRDTVFEYFETMQRFVESGQFDRDPGPLFAPELDTTTYNGSVWLLARRTYWRDPNLPPDPSSPEYGRAVLFYEGHAVGPGYEWSWRNAQQELGVFRETMRNSDNAFRDAQDQLGLLLANHLVSAVDAFISRRLSTATRRPTALRTMLSRDAALVSVSVAF